jgi:hypothetical protein
VVFHCFGKVILPQPEAAIILIHAALTRIALPVWRKWSV